MSPEKREDSKPEEVKRHESEGRVDNAAVAKAPGTSEVEPSSYPATRTDDSVEETGEPRSFDPPPNPRPRQGAGDGGPSPPDEGRQGPAGDPAEGKR